MAPTQADRFVAGVIGHPIAHSKSPALHRAAYQYLGVPLDYSAVDVMPDSVADFAASLTDVGSNWRGVSVTMPHKSPMMGFMDALDASAERVGVLNTVLVSQDRKLTGYNTDVAGIIGALEHAGAEIPAEADVLGAGGTALAAVAALAELGVRHVRVRARHPHRAGAVLALAESLSLTAEPVQLAADSQVESQLLISTLPAHAADALSVRTDAGTLLDVAYDPWPSAVARNFSKASGTVVSGAEMLLYQAVEQVRLFAGDRWPTQPEAIDGVINVMCASIGLPARGSRGKDVAG